MLPHSFWGALCDIQKMAAGETRGQMEQLVAIVAVCRLAILKRMLATPLTLLVPHRLREQVKAQVQRSGKMKT